MRKSTFALSFLILLTCSFTAFAIDCEHPHNKLKNGSFEEADNIGTRWKPIWRVKDWKTAGSNVTLTQEQGYQKCGSYYGLITNNNNYSDRYGSPRVFVYQDVPLTDDVKSVTLTMWAGKHADCYTDIRLIFLNNMGQEIAGSTQTVVVTHIIGTYAGLGEYTLKGTVPTGAKHVRVECGTQKVKNQTNKYMKLDGAVLLFEIETTLPVELASIQATTVEANVEVSWQTASEVNTSRFEVQHSTNGTSWNTLTELEAAGNYEGLLNYRFVHAEPSAGINYYRLKMVDLDGTFEYSKIVNVLYSRAVVNAYLFPNPSTGSVTFGTQNARDIIVLDLSGNPVFRRNGTADKLDLSSLRSGVYMVSWSDEKNQKYSQRLVISH